MRRARQARGRRVVGLGVLREAASKRHSSGDMACLIVSLCPCALQCSLAVCGAIDSSRARRMTYSNLAARVSKCRSHRHHVSPW